MYKILVLGFLSIFILTSCVSRKEFDALAASKASLQAEMQKMKDELQRCKKMRDEVMQKENELEALQAQYKGLNEQYNNLERNNKDLMNRYDKLLDQNSTILNTTSEDKKALSEELAQKQTELTKQSDELDKLEKRLKAKETELNDLRKSLDEREARIASLTEQLDAQKGVLTGLKTKLSNALLGFSDADLTVTQKNGKVYVSMSQNLLFASGSTFIDAKGKDAIIKVASVLAQNKDIDIMVEGHTDTDGTAERNWGLSVDRATEVVKLLTANGVDPKQLTAAGRAFYAPVAPNDTAENKSKNRRTEIVLSPKLSELMKLLES